MFDIDTRRVYYEAGCGITYSVASHPKHSIQTIKSIRWWILYKAFTLEGVDVENELIIEEPSMASQSIMGIGAVPS